MRSLTNFLKMLPGVMPRKARTSILDGNLLTKAERADIHWRETSSLDMMQMVGPDAAAAILGAYKAGRLPMQKTRTPTNAPEADAYLVHADRVRAEIAEYERRRNAVDDPSLLTERDLHDAALLAVIFFRHKGKGPGELSVAGVVVHKTLTAYSTNSGKNHGYHVRFDWVGGDGVARFSEKIPPEAYNRRNDPDRNWGLHE